MRVFLALTALLAVALPPVARSDDAEALGDDKEDNIEEDSLSAEQLQRLHAKLDGDGDGRVSLQEVMAYADTVGVQIAKKDIGTILEEVDTSKDGKLSLEEHLKDIQDQEDGGDEAVMKELAARKEVETAKFKAADSNGDQLLDRSELPGLWYPEIHEGVLTVAATESMRQKDVDKDGKLGPKEFWENDEAQGSDVELSDEEERDFRKLDKDSNGFLDIAELRDWESGRFHTRDAMQRLFDIVDKDSDMHITVQEIAAATDEIAASDVQYHLIDWAEYQEL